MPRFLRFFVFSVVLCAQIAFVDAAAATDSNSASQGSDSSKASSDSQSSKPKAGLTSGAIPIEETILAYQGLQRSAYNIATNAKTAGLQNYVLIGTPDDINAVVQLRIILEQANLLEGRMSTLHTFIGNNCSQAQTANYGFAFPVIAKLLVSLLQPFEQLTAVNEGVASSASDLGDQSLINLVANQLRTNDGSLKVYVPSEFPPALMSENDISNTNIGKELHKIASSRDDLLLDEAQVKNKKQCQQYADTDFLSAQLNAAITAADAFESAVLSGKSASQAPSNKAKDSSSASSSSSGKGGKGSNPASKKNPPPQSSSDQAAATPGSPLQQVLYADLMLSTLGSNAKNTYFLSVHTLESGGSLLGLQSAGGSNIFFSGGVVTTFGLFSPEGNVMCAGISYGYRGFVRESDYTLAIPANLSPSKIPTEKGDTTTCAAPTPLR